jgi:hypothetical protein
MTISKLDPEKIHTNGLLDLHKIYIILQQRWELVGCQTISLHYLILRVEKPEDGDNRFLQIVGNYQLYQLESHT